jgi:hypothetical protein
VLTLTEELSKPITITPITVEKIPDAIERELEELRSQKQAGQAASPAVLKFGIHFESLVSGFQSLLADLAAIAESDAAAHDKYRSAVTGLLGKMSEKLT